MAGMEASYSVGKKKQGKGYSTTPPPSPSSITCDESGSPLAQRNRVQRALARFRTLFSNIMIKYRAEKPRRPYAKPRALTAAAAVMKRTRQTENRKKRVGDVPGIEVGDMFQYRAEISVVGLHRQPWCGIDYTGKGRTSLATSIVVTDRYANTRNSSGTLVYIGHGGNPNARSSAPHHQDQKLEHGNLALWNSMEARSPVRVILKVYGRYDGRNGSATNFRFSYIYDGLYVVDKTVYERGGFGKLVFKFTMNRILGQPSTCFAVNNEAMRQFGVSASRKRRRSKGRVAPRDVVATNDISRGKEKFAIRVVASSDDDAAPRPVEFEYITKVIYGDGAKPRRMECCCCECVDGCVDVEKCSCVAKNGGTMPYDGKKRLASGLESSLAPQEKHYSALKKKKVVFECGPSCKCSSSCASRVSQRGIQFQLEIFKTMFKGWGVRTRSFIPSGSFVCEYIGQVRHGTRAGSRNKLNDYAVNMGVGKGFIDATERGNVARFINHSCFPNLHVKEVMYDHNDMNLPHKMLFAVRDIPAGRELSFDYKTCKARVIGIDGNNCHCAAPICNGRIYI